MNRSSLTWCGAALALTSMVLVGCTAPETDSATATKVIQAVKVHADTSGAVTEIGGTAIFLDETSGESASEETTYEPGDVTSNLPMRITMLYRTAEQSGSDLTELKGHSGRIEIEMTLENLTVYPANVTFDAGGQSHKTPALVGTPLSIAASATLKGVSPTNIIMNPDSNHGTNGVASIQENGDTVIQWGAIIAPPQTGAAVTLRLVLNATDFAPPQFDVAAQAGFHTDLSFDGVIASAFNTGPTSDFGLQQRAIDLISEVNTVLTKAGTTITEVRENLDETSETLGASASAELSHSTESLMREMEMVGTQLAALDKELSASVSSAQQGMNSQLSRIVSSMNAMLGDTTGKPSSHVVGEGCAAKVIPTKEPSTVYATFLQLSGLLDGYSKANKTCLDQVIREIDKTLGPEVPNPEVCTESSMTCSLFEANQAINEELSAFERQTQAVLDNFAVEGIQSAVASHQAVGGSLNDLQGILDEQEPGVYDPNAWKVAKDAADAGLKTVETLGTLQNIVSAVHENLVGEGNSVKNELNLLAEDICSLQLPETPPLSGANGDAPGPDDQSQSGRPQPESPHNDKFQEEKERLHAKIVGTKCNHEPITDNTSVPLSSMVQSQADELGNIIPKLSLDPNQTSPTDEYPLAKLENALLTINEYLDTLGDPGSGGPSSTDSLVEDLRPLLKDATDAHEELGSLLEEVEENEATLKETLEGDLEKASHDAGSRVEKGIDEQIDTVTEEVGEGRAKLIESFDATVNGLASASSDVTENGKSQINSQQSALTSTGGEVSSDLDDKTKDSIERIGTSTGTSTKNIAAASALLQEDLAKVILDLGDPEVEGSGVLGAMASSAAKTDSADYQLALASQRASGYANVRAEDMAGMMLRRAQFEAALNNATSVPPFNLSIPEGASAQTIFTFHLREAEK